MPSSNTVGDDSLGDTRSDGSLDDSSDRVHRTNDLGLELGRHVELDLLEEVLGRTEATNDKHVLQKLVKLKIVHIWSLTCRDLFCA